MKNRRYCPREFLSLRRDDVDAMCQQLRGLDPAEQPVFWKSRHGALGGKTMLESLSGSARREQLAKVVRLAPSLAAQASADAAQAA